MDKINEVDWKNLPKEEAILLAMKIFNSSRSEAEFFVAMARGETTGDCHDLTSEKTKISDSL